MQGFGALQQVFEKQSRKGQQIAFEIYDSDNHRVTMKYTYPQVISIHIFYTNKEGYLITPEKLPYVRI